MRKRDKTCAKATPEEPKREQPDERGRAADCGPLSGEIQDNEQVALAAGDYSHVYS